MLFLKIWLSIGLLYWTIHTLRMMGIRPWAFDAVDHAANILVGLPFCLIFGPFFMFMRIMS